MKCYLTISFKSLHQPWGVGTIISLDRWGNQGTQKLCKNLVILTTIKDTTHNIRKKIFSWWLDSIIWSPHCNILFLTWLHRYMSWEEYPCLQPMCTCFKATHTALWRDFWLLPRPGFQTSKVTISVQQWITYRRELLCLTAPNHFLSTAGDSLHSKRSFREFTLL